MARFSIFFALGVWLLQMQSALPAFAWAWLLILPALLLWLPHRAFWQRMLRHGAITALALALGFFYAAFSAQQRLADKLPDAWQGVNVDVVGVVAELPRQREDGLSFAFDVEQVATPGAHVPEHILLSTYDRDQPIPVKAGERWRFTVRLKQPHGTANPYGFDFEAWMLERRLRASGYVRDDGNNARLDESVYAPGYLIERLREKVRDRFRAVLGNAPYSGVLAALSIGDQGSIPAAQWQVFTRTGVNHLMSISGLHITMFAALAYALTYALWRRSVRLVLAFPARKAAAITGLLAALAYALLSGFSIPAQRTVYMLATVAMALLLARRVAPSQLLAAALLVVLACDPWAVTAPGFWLSFGAVALILYISANRIGKTHWLAEYGRVQWAMLAGMVPPLLALFQQISLVSPIANAFAIPLVSFVVAPLAILGAVVPVDGVLWLAHGAMSLCMSALEWLNRLPDAVWQQHAPPAWGIALGMAGALWLLLPRGFPARWLGLFLLLPMFLVLPEAPREGAVRLVIFDVGQGLSVAAQTHDHVLLYDAGPDFPGEADSGNRILVPSLRAQGIARLNALMLTHDDTDHTGGALSVMQAMPIGWMSSSLPDDSPIVRQADGQQRCTDGQRWDWDGVHFEILHPSRASYADNGVSKNNRGCTLRISTGTSSVLLAADIEKDSEQRLLHLHPDKLPATLLVVPHHGSKTSSTQAFVQAVHPRYAVFTAGYRNRFGHPKEEVVARYRAIGAELLRSDEDGAVIVEMDGNTFRIERWRKTHARYWQQGTQGG
ncbi:MAG TPA: DNA internalization-related competence protein ComEC/Rec2 [Gallionellaceae bacterium]